MERGTVQERLEILEEAMAGLADLPEQVGGFRSQLSSLDSRLGTVETRLTSVESRVTSVESRLTSVESQIVRLETRMGDGFSAIRTEFVNLKGSMNERFDQTNTYMRVLHEKVVSDIRTLYEGRQ